eukprot:m.27580 g.27580  ORF g.27580 m.27580 type:complete len:112 (-) comp6450_c0_seq1:2286-2621(-)
MPSASRTVWGRVRCTKHVKALMAATIIALRARSEIESEMIQNQRPHQITHLSLTNVDVELELWKFNNVWLSFFHSPAKSLGWKLGGVEELDPVAVIDCETWPTSRSISSYN